MIVALFFIGTHLMAFMLGAIIEQGWTMRRLNEYINKRRNEP